MIRRVTTTPGVRAIESSRRRAGRLWGPSPAASPSEGAQAGVRQHLLNELVLLAPCRIVHRVLLVALPLLGGPDVPLRWCGGGRVGRVGGPASDGRCARRYPITNASTRDARSTPIFTLPSAAPAASLAPQLTLRASSCFSRRSRAAIICSFSSASPGLPEALTYSERMPMAARAAVPATALAAMPLSRALHAWPTTACMAARVPTAAGVSTRQRGNPGSRARARLGVTQRRKSGAEAGEFLRRVRRAGAGTAYLSISGVSDALDSGATWARRAPTRGTRCAPRSV